MYFRVIFIYKYKEIYLRKFVLDCLCGLDIRNSLMFIISKIDK